MRNEFDISKILTINTCHISEETAKALKSQATDATYPLVIYSKDNFGWFIFIPDYYSDDKEDTPEDLHKCIELALKNDCSWLCIDCDGPETDELEKYDW